MNDFGTLEVSDDIVELPNETTSVCTDNAMECPLWALSNFCGSMADFMRSEFSKSCGVCGDKVTFDTFSIVQSATPTVIHPTTAPAIVHEVDYSLDDRQLLGQLHRSPVSSSHH